MFTFLFSDIEGSTGRWELHREAMQSALARHDALMRECIEQRDGIVFKTVGDAFCAVFRDVEDAARAAIDAQKAIAAADWTAIGGLRVRMALHTGQAEERDGDFFGPTVNRVARILAVGHGGQVLLSAASANLLDDRAQFGEITSLGSHRLRDIPQPQQLYQLEGPGLPHEFPPLHSLDAHPNNLPSQATSFVGRMDEVDEIAALLLQERLVSLLGAGGVGKTRSALTVAAQVLERFPDGAWFVDLAPIAEPALVTSALAQVLYLSDSGGGTLTETIVSALRSKTMLLVIDNCEHVIEAAAAIVDRIVSGCPGVRILATSRETLHVAGEHPYRMPSLSVADGVALFAARAGASNAGFILSEHNAAIVEDIVRRVDGIPLAIELAASRVRVLGVDQVARRLDERFALLSGGNRNALPRQQTLRALITWSYDLLSPAERSFLCQAAIFRGGFSLDAAQEICIEALEPGWSVPDLIESLFDKSLILAEPLGDEMRYRMLETTRQFAMERLKERGDEDPVQARHCAFFRAVAESIYESVWRVNLEDWLGRAKLELENLRAAIDWGLTCGNDVAAGSEIVVNLRGFWYEISRTEGRALLRAVAPHASELPPRTFARLKLAEASLDEWASSLDTHFQAVALFENSDDRVGLVNALRASGRELMRTLRTEESIAQMERAAAIAPELGMPRLLAISLTELATCIANTGQDERTLSLYDTAIDIFRKCGDRQRMTIPLANLSREYFNAGDNLRAIECARQSEAIAREARSERVLTEILGILAEYCIRANQIPEALAYGLEAFERASRAGHRYVFITVEFLATIAAQCDCLRTSALLAGYVDGVRTSLDAKRESEEETAHQALMAKLQSSLAEERLAACLAEGGALSDADLASLVHEIAVPMDAATGTA